MKLIELKEKYPLVYAEGLRQCNTGCDENDHIGSLFTWMDSKQGEIFWNHIRCKRFKKAEEICPELFIKPLKTKSMSKEIKFCTPVSMEVTNEQYERDLKDKLSALGYEESGIPKDMLLLVTRDVSVPNHVGGYKKSDIKDQDILFYQI